MLPATARPRFENLGDIVESLGNISPKCICFDPVPGKATARDLIRVLDSGDRLYELVDGTLVEKAVGVPESRLNNKLIRQIDGYVEDHGLGFTLGPDGPVRLLSHLIRLPDLTFVSWEKRPGRTYPTEKVIEEVPDLAVEVISRGNRRGEMKLQAQRVFPRRHPACLVRIPQKEKDRGLHRSR